MYCPVPKVATKTILTVMLYMHVRDINEHLNTNWTNIDVFRAQMEQMINISGFIQDLRQNGITIPKTEEPKSLTTFLLKALILSDDQYTPGQSQLFLSHFQIDEFINLQSLTLIEIERKSLEIINEHLYKLNR
ncbi:unnamed protein product, partial [Rotaria sordida]